ncbi:MAG: hypothetical protein E7355_04180 [Clostridiales bacterium]|nr:hypothetical protein [Clostridiales bacterium]
MRRNTKALEEFKRVNDVIQGDKSLMSDACKSLVLQDFAEKFNEYFDVIGLPRMELSCKNGTYHVSLSFEAERIKKFNVLK